MFIPLAVGRATLLRLVSRQITGLLFFARRLLLELPLEQGLSDELPGPFLSVVVDGLGQGKQRGEQDGEQRPDVFVLHEIVEFLPEGELAGGGRRRVDKALLLFVEVAAEEVLEVEEARLVVDKRVLAVGLDVVGGRVELVGKLVVADYAVGGIGPENVKGICKV